MINTIYTCNYTYQKLTIQQNGILIITLCWASVGTSRPSPVGAWCASSVGTSWASVGMICASVDTCCASVDKSWASVGLECASVGTS